MKPLEGIGVLEVAMYGFVPSAGAVLADWGADVIKVEHAVTGDPQRGLRQTGLLRVEGDPNPNIEHANRCKRSVGLDMSVPEGKEVLYELARRSDVFLTSFLPGHRKKFGIDVDDIRAVNPKIVYARGSALGPRGIEAEKGGYRFSMDFSRLRYMNSSTITPVIFLIQGLKRTLTPIVLRYDQTVKWQQLAFSALRVFTSGTGPMELIGSGEVID